jgi:hypothetical protein
MQSTAWGDASHPRGDPTGVLIAHVSINLRLRAARTLKGVMPAAIFFLANRSPRLT